MLGDLEGHLAYLADREKGDICHLIHYHASLFVDKPTQTILLQHDVDVGDHEPIKQYAYRVNPVKRVTMQREVAYLLENGFVVPSSSPWSSPSLLVPKSDQAPCFCNDYRRVNTITKPDSFPLPRMDDCLDCVGSAKYVTNLDMLKGYWQVLLSLCASDISAFITPDNFLHAFWVKKCPCHLPTVDEYSSFRCQQL